MAIVNIKIEGQDYKVDNSLTLLQAARKCGYQVPSLCSWMDGRCSLASCRVCLVKVKGERRLVPSCAYPVREGLEVSINDPMAIEARRTSVELLLSNHSMNCQACEKNGKCELLEVSRLVGAREGMYEGEKTPTTYDDIAPALIRDTSKCILCGRCVETCKQVQGIGILGFENRGFKTIVAPVENRSFAQVPCIQCGQCVNVCPTGALQEHSEIDKLDEAFKQGKIVIVQTAPAVRAAIAEEFGEKIGTSGTGKMVAALHRLGFYRVFDTNFGADLTIMEEANELVHRLTTSAPSPMITSCSPGWINYIEYYYPELLPHLSSCKSPHEMVGAIIKSYYAEKHNLDRSKICVVSIMPCVAKKYENKRPQNAVDGIPDVDVVLTTRELAKIIRRAGITWKKLPNEDFDQDLLGEYTGAGVIFGATGGVMEAAVRTAYHIITGDEMEPVDFTPVRGLKGIKDASVTINGNTLNIAVASSMKNAKILLDEIKAGKSKYQFIEIMGCPGGCINGGGQPFVKEIFLPNEDDDIMQTYMLKRAKVLYDEDKNKAVRRSHLNKDVQALYKSYLKEPGSPIAHKLLHTSYNKKREKYPKLEEE
ncbi:MAG: iron hydrogenase small subunit [Acholeplasmatales bacterium]|nr:iron hydrogenase small subunit [Acholeplasmatales bacterium]